jgi:hypothetical protein
VIALRDQDHFVQLEDVPGAKARVVGASAGEVQDDRFLGHTQGSRVFPHPGRLVVAGDAIVAAEQEPADPSGAVEFDGGIQTIAEDIAEGSVTPVACAKDQRDASLGNGVQLLRPVDLILIARGQRPGRPGSQRADRQRNRSQCSRSQARSPEGGETLTDVPA